MSLGGRNTNPPDFDGSERIEAGEPRLRRLSHLQWRNTVVDLLHLDDEEAISEVGHLAEGFRPDPRQDGYAFSAQTAAMLLDAPLLTAYRRAAAFLAAHVTANEVQASKLGFDAQAADDEESSHVQSFIRDFGLRAHRAPLSQQEVEEYFQLYLRGKTAYEGEKSTLDGLRLLLEGFLVSPYFLYRIERTVGQESNTRLSAFERATRLSYFLWETMPDEALFEAAADGRLNEPEVWEGQVHRLAEDPRAATALLRFLTEYFKTESYQYVRPDKSFFPERSTQFGEYAARETELFFEQIVLAEEGGIRELLTSPYSYVNQEMAQVYGLSGEFGEEFERVRLPQDERPGVLLRVGFLARQSRIQEPDTIHRGIVVARDLSCIDLPAPPPGAPQLPEVSATSNRETVAALTEQEGSSCIVCHKSLINPFGYAFEHFGVAGIYRDHDAGTPIDASAEVLIDDDYLPVDGAAELMAALAESSQVHRCLVGHFLSFAQGRVSDGRDGNLVAALTNSSQRDAASFLDLARELALSESFSERRRDDEE